MEHILPALIGAGLLVVLGLALLAIWHPRAAPLRGGARRGAVAFWARPWTPRSAIWPIVILIIFGTAQLILSQNQMAQMADAPGWLTTALWVLWLTALGFTVAAMLPNAHGPAGAHSDYAAGVLIPLLVATFLVGFQALWTGTSNEPERIALEGGYAMASDGSIKFRSADTGNVVKVPSGNLYEAELMTRDSNAPEVSGFTRPSGFSRRFYAVTFEKVAANDPRDIELATEGWDKDKPNGLSHSLPLLKRYASDDKAFDCLSGRCVAPARRLPLNFLGTFPKNDASSRTKGDMEQKDQPPVTPPATEVPPVPSADSTPPASTSSSAPTGSTQPPQADAAKPGAEASAVASTSTTSATAEVTAAPAQTEPSTDKAGGDTYIINGDLYLGDQVNNFTSTAKTAQKAKAKPKKLVVKGNDKCGQKPAAKAEDKKDNPDNAQKTPDKDVPEDRSHS